MEEDSAQLDVSHSVRFARRLMAKFEGVTDHEQRSFLLREWCTAHEPHATVLGLREVVRLALSGEGREVWLAVSAALCSDALPYPYVRELYRAAREEQLTVMQALLIAGNRSYKRAEETAFARDKVLEELTLGERKAKARLGDRAILERLLYDPDVSVLTILLNNPKLTEDDVLRLASKRPNRPQVLAQIALTYRWFRRGSVQRALLLNPYAPLRISVSILPLLSVQQLYDVSRDGSLHPLVARAAKAILKEMGWKAPVFH